LLAALAGAISGNAAGQVPATAAPSDPARPPASERLQEVTVTARRLELEKRIAQFVNQIAATENWDEGLARWQVPPVCPLVSGLPQNDGEFILERLSAVARSSGVPISDDEKCRPNLYVLVTDQPQALLRSMEKRNRGFTFGYDYSTYPREETSPTIVDEFIDSPRAVKAWYNSQEKDIWDNPTAYCAVDDVLPSSERYGGRFIRCTRGIAGGSHLMFSGKWTIWTAFVIVDRNRLHGVKLGQLADYISMAGFAKLRTDAKLGAAASILALFDATPEAAPTGMTAWDQAFLRSLYETDQKSRQQRGEIARAMVREIIPP
jgi:hypothetical protein